MLNAGEQLIAKVDANIADEIATLRHQKQALEETLEEVKSRERKYQPLVLTAMRVLMGHIDERQIATEVHKLRESL
jgi:FtsZ-binding cell division protein ZapB